jgi:hypothetical protein
MCYSSKKEKLLVHLLKRLLVNLNHVFVFSLFFSAVALLDICVVALGEGVHCKRRKQPLLLNYN